MAQFSPFISRRRYPAEVSARFKDISVLSMIYVGHTMIKNCCQLLQMELLGILYSKEIFPAFSVYSRMLFTFDP
jgi:hypothetical protein